MIKKYGVEYFSLTEEYKRQRKEKSEQKRSFIKKPTKEERKQLNIQRSMEKYGVPYSIQSEIVREKIRKTSLEKYGCENPLQSDEAREHAK